MKLMGSKPSVGIVVAAALMLPWMGMIVPASAGGPTDAIGRIMNPASASKE